MSTARLVGVFQGTNETTGVTVAAGATSVGAQVDVLGNDTSAGSLNLYLVYTAPTNAAGAMLGTINIVPRYQPVSGAAYTQTQDNFQVPVLPGTNEIYLGVIPNISRYMAVDVVNNSRGPQANVPGVPLTNVTLRYECFAVS